MKPELTKPDFRLSWRNSAYYVSKPNIGNTDVFTPETVQRLIDEAYEAGKVDAFEDDGDFLTIAYLHEFDKGKAAALTPPEQPK